MDFYIRLKYTLFSQIFFLKKSINQKLPTAVPSRSKKSFFFFSKTTQLYSEVKPASYSVGTRASLPGIKLKYTAFRKYFLPLTSILYFVSFLKTQVKINQTITLLVKQHKMTGG